MFRKQFAKILLAFALLTLLRAAGAQPQIPVTNDPVLLADRIVNLEIEETARYQPIKELLEADPEISFTVLRDNWTKIRSNEAKIALINTYLCAANPHIVEILDLGAHDPNLAVQSFAIQAAETISFRSLADDFNAYLAWRKSAEGKTLEQVLEPGIRDFVARFTAATDMERETMLAQLLTRQFSQPTKISRARRKAILDAGILEPLAKCLDPRAGFTNNQYALQFLRNLRVDSEFLKKAILPLAGKDTQINLRSQALTLLGAAENTWAVEPLTKMLLDEYPDPVTYTIGQTLGAIGDPRPLPTLIAMLDADNSQQGLIEIGNVLFRLTGVYVTEEHDAAWWHKWLDKNKGRLPADLREAPLPKVALRKRAPDFNVNASPPNRAELRHANADPHSAYWLIIPNERRVGQVNFNNGINNGGVRVAQALPQNGQIVRNRIINGALVAEKAPAGGQAGQPGRLGLLVVLAAGDGNGANALNFWQDIANTVLKGRYMIALPVAPRWNADQKIAWITADNKKEVKEAKFTTESFISDLVKEVGGAYPFDTNRLFLHGAAESGQAVYACSLEPATPFKGFYLVASPFKSTQLPSLKQAKGRRYFLQHSKDDKSSPFLMAAAAQKLLEEQGAVVKLSPYRGKTGYDFEDGREKTMGEAFTWLETGK